MPRPVGLLPQVTPAVSQPGALGEQLALALAVSLALPVQRADLRGLPGYLGGLPCYLRGLSRYLGGLLPRLPAEYESGQP
jgi:hypothetical protein